MAVKAADTHTHTHNVYLLCPYKAHLGLFCGPTYLGFLLLACDVYAIVVMFYCMNAHQHQESTMVLFGKVSRDPEGVAQYLGQSSRYTLTKK